jgi:hypothetical protein
MSERRNSQRDTVDQRDIVVHKNSKGAQDGYNAMLERIKTGAVALSIEVTASGVRYWATAPNPMTLIRLVARLDPVPPGMDAIDPQHGYEVINPDAPHCLYLDIEDEREGRDNEALLSSSLAVVRETLIATFGDAIDTTFICIDATNDHKLSKHIIYPHVIFNCLRSTRALMDKVTAKIDSDETYASLRWPFDAHGKRRVYPWVLDTSVYSRYRCFRLPLCRKRKVNSTPLTICVEQSTHVFASVDAIDRVLESTCQWRLHNKTDNYIIRAMEQPPMLAMAAAGRKNPRTSIPISISIANWTDNIFLRTAWSAIEGERWWPTNKKTTHTDELGAIVIYVYASPEYPAFCPIKCYYNKYMAFRSRNNVNPTLLRWQPDGAVTPSDCHDGNAHVKINVSAYEFCGIRYLSVNCYCFRGCYRIMRGLGWDCKLKDRISFPQERKNEDNAQQQPSATHNSPVGGSHKEDVSNTKTNPQQPQLPQ